MYTCICTRTWHYNVPKITKLDFTGPRTTAYTLCTHTCISQVHKTLQNLIKYPHTFLSHCSCLNSKPLRLVHMYMYMCVEGCGDCWACLYVFTLYLSLSFSIFCSSLCTWLFTYNWTVHVHTLGDTPPVQLVRPLDYHCPGISPDQVDSPDPI